MTLHFNTNLKMARKIERFLVSKVDFVFKISQRNNNLPIDPILLSCVHVIKEVPIIKFSRNSKSLKVIYFYSFKFES